MWLFFLCSFPLEGFDRGGVFELLIGLGGFVAVVAILFNGFLLLRRFGVLSDPPFMFGRRRSSNDAARQLLAERMARDEISGEEFLERASLLNWTPGSDGYPNRAIRRR